MDENWATLLSFFPEGWKELAVATNAMKEILLQNSIEQALKESANLKLSLIKFTNNISDIINKITDALLKKNKLLIMGNGGSAADAQHIAGELIGRFKLERSAIPSIALSTDTSIITAIGNDFSFNNIFSRQIEALATNGDVVLGISTSGNSKNIVNAIKTAKQKKLTTIAFLGGNGGEIKKMVDLSIVVPSENTPRIQEAHIAIAHIVCNEIEKAWFHKNI